MTKTIMGFEWQYFLVKLGPNGPNGLWWRTWVDNAIVFLFLSAKARAVAAKQTALSFVALCQSRSPITEMISWYLLMNYYCRSSGWWGVKQLKPAYVNLIWPLRLIGMKIIWMYKNKNLPIHYQSTKRFVMGT